MLSSIGVQISKGVTALPATYTLECLRVGRTSFDHHLFSDLQAQGDLCTVHNIEWSELPVFVRQWESGVRC
jgi:hypothetical protein